MKKFLKIIGVLAAVFIIFCVGMFFYIKAQPVPAVEIGAIDLNSVRDGSYTGQYELAPVKVVVKVDITDHKITAINILEHQTGLGKPAEKITGDIISTQSLQVDTVSGSTQSSRTILKAVENALSKGI